jgi:imidazolonepropionase-like amidohydrolase
MNRHGAATVLLAALASGLQAHASDQVPGTPQSKPVLLRGGDLYTVSHGTLAATDLLFDQGKIAKIGQRLDVPKDAEVVDVTGKRIYPGLIAPATTLGLIEIGAVRATNDMTEVGGITPEAAAHVAYNTDSELLPTIRNHGITTAQVMPAGSLLRGRPFVTYLDGWTKEDSAVRLTYGMAVTWPVLPRRNPFGEARRSREDLEKERRESLKRLENAFDDAKAYLANRGAETPVDLDVRHEAMRGVVLGHEPVFIDVDTYAGIREALAFAEKEKVRLVLVGAADAWRLAHELQEQDVAVILGGALGLPRREDDPYDAAFRAPAVLHEAGVKFCISDTGDSWGVRNLGLHAAQAVAFGLPADAALRAITLSAAEILGIDSQLGSLDVGKAATLFVSDGDPLDSLTRHVTDVWIDGRRVDLDDRHKELYRKYKQKPATAAKFELPPEKPKR